MALQDGSNLFGVPGTITIAGVESIAENINIDRGGGVSETRGNNNETNAQYFFNDQATGTATLQIDTVADATTLFNARNTQSGVFSMTVGSAAENWVLTSVGQVYQQGEAYKLNIGFRKAVTVTPTP